MAWLLGLAKGALGAISGFLSAAVRWAAIGFAFLAGKRSAEKKAAEKALERAREALEIDEDVRRLSTSDLDKRLRE